MIPGNVGDALNREQSFKVRLNLKMETGCLQQGARKNQGRVNVSSGARQWELPVISGRTPCRDSNDEGAGQLETVVDRLRVKLCRSRPCKCQRGGINPQATRDASSAERLRKPGSGMRQGPESCLSRLVSDGAKREQT